MWIWHRGAVAVQKRVEAGLTPLSDLIGQLDSGKIARVPGSAVFFTRVKDQTPPVMAWHVRHNRSLHEHVLALTMTVLSVPRVDPEERLTLRREGDHFWRAEARLGFMEHPDFPQFWRSCKAKGAEIDVDDVTYYVGSETIVPCEDGKGLPRWQEVCSRRWAAMRRGSAIISNCRAIMWSRSAARSRFEARRGRCVEAAPSIIRASSRRSPRFVELRGPGQSSLGRRDVAEVNVRGAGHVQAMFQSVADACRFAFALITASATGLHAEVVTVPTAPGSLDGANGADGVTGNGGNGSPGDDASAIASSPTNSSNTANAFGGAGGRAALALRFRWRLRWKGRHGDRHCNDRDARRVGRRFRGGPCQWRRRRRGRGAGGGLGGAGGKGGDAKADANVSPA